MGPTAFQLILIVIFFVFADSLRVIVGQALNGLSDMKMPALIMGLGHWLIGFPTALLFGLIMDMGVSGFWLGLTVGMAAIGIAYLLRFHRLNIFLLHKKKLSCEHIYSS